ncbi:hypothetical protein QQ020_31570 [Fulvivirgaceae bacterium BMA12]|uniref:Uncharacterized protein n=1 Tax=Agaribacillus aureus TaxID=3051825 RepID=A0ABT8LJS1_9BACT|nr:hypothetical protein [Fulvivirgaceae bacterium BMA12]
MRLTRKIFPIYLAGILWANVFAFAHPLRLSLCEIEYTPDQKLLKVNLKLFLTDVNEGLVFDPYSEELRFCQPNEHSEAETLLLNYLNKYFYLKINGKKLPLEIKSKKLSGTGDNTALWLFFQFEQVEEIRQLEIRDDVFTDLFFDQSNLVYAHINGEPRSLMLNKKSPVYTLTY